MITTLLIWTVALQAICGGVVAAYLSSRHQKLVTAAPPRYQLRVAQWTSALIAYLLLCQIVTVVTAAFVLVTFAMLFFTLLPPMIGYVKRSSEAGR